MNINSNDHLFYPYSIKINTCSGSCNNVNDLYANLCVPDVVEGKNVKLFNGIKFGTKINVDLNVKN